MFLKKLGVTKWGALLFCFFCFSFQAEARDCKTAITQALEKFGGDKRELYVDFDKKTTYFFWGRLRKIFDATNPKEIDELFTDVIKNEEDLTELFFGIKSGEINVDSYMAHLVEDLYNFMKQQQATHQPVSFWIADNRLFHIQEALKADETDRHMDASPEAAAAQTRIAVDRGTLAVLSRALAEHHGKKFPNTKWSDGLARWFKPHYAKAVRIVGYLQNLNKSLIYIYLADSPMFHALGFYKDVLNEAETSTVRKLIEETAGQFEEIRHGIATLFGREIGTVHEVTQDEVVLREMVNRIDDARKESADLDARKRQAEKKLDQLDDALAGNFARRHAEKAEVPATRPFAEYEATHLRIRNEQYARETPELTHEYYGTCERSPNEADYKVDAQWTYTVEYSRTVYKDVDDFDDKGQKTGSHKEPKIENTSETYTHSTERFTLVTDYNEVIDGKIVAKAGDVAPQLPSAPHTSKIGWDVDSAHNNTDSVDITWVDQNRTTWILDQAQKARAIEQPRREQVQQSIAEVKAIVEGYPKNIEGDPQNHADVLAHLDKLRAELAAEQQKVLQEYHQWDQAHVSSNWAYDVFADFQDRNRQLNNRYLHLIKRIDHLREQVLRKQNPLIVTFEGLPDYTPQLTDLDHIRHRIRVQQGVIGGVAAAILGGSAYWYWGTDHDKDKDKDRDRDSEGESATRVPVDTNDGAH